MLWPAIQELLPQQGYMSLLDEVVDIQTNHLVAAVTLTETSSFNQQGSMGSWIGIEYMAQSIAALVNWEAIQQDQQVKPGVLLGTRRYQAEQPYFPLHQQLLIKVERAFQSNDGLAAFECQILSQDRVLASATLTAYQPNNFANFINQGTLV